MGFQTPEEIPEEINEEESIPDRFEGVEFSGMEYTRLDDGNIVFSENEAEVFRHNPETGISLMSLGNDNFLGTFKYESGLHPKPYSRPNTSTTLADTLDSPEKNCHIFGIIYAIYL